MGRRSRGGCGGSRGGCEGIGVMVGEYKKIEGGNGEVSRKMEEEVPEVEV